MAICLNMIVRDEAGNLPRLFASVAPWVDYYVICDTGSVDGTAAEVQRLGDAYGIDGLVHHHAWRDFAHNRNLALRAAEEARARGLHDCGWVMVMDADEELSVADTAWKTGLCAGRSYLAAKRTGRISVAHPMLLWMRDGNWQWEGATHNYLSDRDAVSAMLPLTGVHIVYHEFEGGKSHPFADGVMKSDADAAMLEEELAGAALVRDNAHRHFQLACAYRNTGRKPMAVEILRRLMHTPDAGRGQRYAAAILSARISLEARDFDKPVFEALEAASRLAPSRWEAPFYLAMLHRAQGQASLALARLEDCLSMEPADASPLFYREDEIYEWRAAYEHCFLLHLAGREPEALHAVDVLKRKDALPAPERAFLDALETRIRQGTTGGNPSKGNTEADSR